MFKLQQSVAVPRSIKLWFVISIITLSIAGCNNMSERDRNTVIGAGLGAAGGAILTDGNPAGVIGGAAVGGIIGNVTTNDGDDGRWERRDSGRRDDGYSRRGRDGYGRGGHRRNRHDD